MSEDVGFKLNKIKVEIDELSFIIEQKETQNISYRSQRDLIQNHLEENNDDIECLKIKINELVKELGIIFNQSGGKLKWKIKKVFIIGFLPFFPRKIVWISNWHMFLLNLVIVLKFEKNWLMEIQ